MKLLPILLRNPCGILRCNPYGILLRNPYGIAITLCLCLTPTAQAQTCASNCGAPPIQFTPGQPVRLEMVNHTLGLVQIEQVLRTNPVPLLPGQELQLDPSFGTNPNTSVLFWDETTLPVRAIVSQPSPQTLRIDIRPGISSPGDRSVYIENDGRVTVF